MEKDKKIKVRVRGPYLVTGGVPITEKRIVHKIGRYEYEDGRPLEQKQTYLLCRCGQTSTPPFCDGSHAQAGFDAHETADMSPYAERAELLEGPGIDLLDDGRCAFARFCHRHGSDVWELTEESDKDAKREDAIIAASECPSGRLTAVTKSGEHIEPPLEPGIDVLQDPGQRVSGPLFVRGGIAIESDSGKTYEIRNRVALCRCGKSENMPFCDASHIDVRFRDGHVGDGRDGKKNNP